MQPSGYHGRRRAAWLYLPLLLAAPALAQAPAPVTAGSASESAAGASQLPSDAPREMAAIDRSDLERLATYLASDELGGRYTGSEGQLQAARYVAKRFEELGLTPLGDRGRGGRDWFQRYPLERSYLSPQGTELTVDGEEHGSGFAVIPGRSADRLQVAGKLIWCGDGSDERTPHGRFDRMLPVVELDDPVGESRGGGRRGGQVIRQAEAINRHLAGRGAKVVLFTLPSESGRIADALNTLALSPEKPLLQFGAEGRAPSPHKVPSVFLGRPLALTVMAKLGVDAAGRLSQKEPATVPAKLRLDVREDDRASAVNVVAVLEGAHPQLSKEAVLFSAHMDHLGTRLDGQAFNGADDNASGTAGLLEIAQAFAEGPRPDRSIVFLSVSGEELGLWGSKYFTEHPSWPLELIVADVNIDMIGRATDLSGASAISITPSHDHPYYNTLGREAARLGRVLGLSLSSGDIYYQRSDHYNFALKGVPVVFFSDGEHEDYHRVTDDADKLDYGKVERVARLAFWTGTLAASGTARPQRLGSQADW